MLYIFIIFYRLCIFYIVFCFVFFYIICILHILYIYTLYRDLQCPMCGCWNSRQVALLLGCHKVVWSMSKRRISLVLQVVFSPSKVIKRSSRKFDDLE